MGHIFRKRFPYESVSVANIVKKNSIRVAEVWLDEYKVNKKRSYSFVIDFNLEKLLRTIQL